MIVEDDRVLFEVVSQALDDAGYAVCEQVASGDHASVAVAREQPDVVLMDIQLGGSIDGISAAQRLRENRWPGLLIYFTAHASHETLRRAQGTRPEAYLLKPVAPRQLLATVELALARGRHELQMRDELRKAQEALSRIWEVSSAPRYQGEGSQPDSREAQRSLRRQLERLSRREREVFERAVRGEPLEQVARMLFISPHTARNHLAAIYRKLGVSSRLELSTTYLPLAGPGAGRDTE